MTQKSETIFFSIIVRLTFFVTGLHPSRKHTFSIVLPNNLPLLRVRSIELRISLKLKHRHNLSFIPPPPLRYVPRVRDIYSNSRSYTDNFLLDIRIRQGSSKYGWWDGIARKGEISIEIRDHKSRISRAESRKSSGATPRWIFSRAFIGSNRSIWLDLSHSSRHRTKLCTWPVLRVEAGGRGGRLYDSPLYFPVFQGESNTLYGFTRHTFEHNSRSSIGLRKMFPFRHFASSSGMKFSRVRLLWPITALLFKFPENTRRFPFARNRIGIGSLYSSRNFFTVFQSLRHLRRSIGNRVGKLCFDNFSKLLVSGTKQDAGRRNGRWFNDDWKSGREEIRFCGPSLAALTSQHDSIRIFCSLFVHLYVDSSRRLIGRIRRKLFSKQFLLRFRVGQPSDARVSRDELAANFSDTLLINSIDRINYTRTSRYSLTNTLVNC